MDVDHNSLVAFAKSWGLLYLIALFVIVVVWAYWPRNRKRFDRAAKSILKDDDRPHESGNDNDNDSERRP